MKVIEVKGETPGEYLKSMVLGKRELFELGLDDDDLWDEDAWVFGNADPDVEHEVRYGREANGEPTATVVFGPEPDASPSDADVLETILLAAANDMVLNH